MAHWYTPIVFAGLFALVGCQPAAQQTSLVRNLPAPNFSGPSLRESSGVARLPSPPAPAELPPVVSAEPRAAEPMPHGHGAVPAAWVPVAHANQWYWIIIHHSATPTGGAAAFDKMHRAKGWDELGYHFVIGNGTDTGNGQIEVGSRWPKQKWGAHAKTPDNRYNEHGIGICLVGNFDVNHPTQQQLRSLNKLVAYLMATYHIPADHVLGHRDTKSTDCPGRNLNVAQVRRTAVQTLAAAGEPIPHGSRSPALARGELLTDSRESASR